jgi:hypothetical protein
MSLLARNIVTSHVLSAELFAGETHEFDGKPTLN